MTGIVIVEYFLKHIDCRLCYMDTLN